MLNVKTVWIDTAIIIYYLRTNKDFTPKVIALIEEAKSGNIQLKLSPLVISECVFVLMGKQFNVNKQLVKTALLSFINLPGVIAEEKSVIEETLTNYARKDIDFTDAYIAAHARAVKAPHIITESLNFKGLYVLAEIEHPLP